MATRDSTPSPRRRTPRARALEIHVQLTGLEPPIWRRFWVDDGISLLELHHVLQAVMGWTDAHLHEFRIGAKVYATPDPDDLDGEEIERVDERTVRLCDVLKLGTRFEYVYDFGDYWVHRLEVEQSKALDQPAGAAYVTEGMRACPPEDCGGVPGYSEFLEALAHDPHGEEVADFLRWTGDDFDPEEFERRSANAALLRMAWNGWGKPDDER